MKLLLTSDLHIGRIPARVPADEAGVASCAAAWERLVEVALNQQVRAILIAGDLVDAENCFFEAMGPLGQGLSRLHESGIDVLMVAGNHDATVLSRILGALKDHSNVRLLGRDGEWETCMLTDDSGGRVQVVGWSYPVRQPDASPLDALAAGMMKEGIPTIGLFHSDVGAPNSPYCGSSRRDFQGLPVDLWVVGHVHKPTHTLLDDGTGLLVPGSPQGVDPGPGEVGPHGPWLLEVDGDTLLPTHVRNAPLRYESVAISLSQAVGMDALVAFVWDGLRARIQDFLAETPDLRAVCARILVDGESDLSVDHVKDLLAAQLEDVFDVAGVAVVVDRLVVDLVPSLDLEALSSQSGVLGELARLVCWSGGKEFRGSPWAGAIETPVDAVLADPAFRQLTPEV
jgi:exonuclease SbcD